MRSPAPRELRALGAGDNYTNLTIVSPSDILGRGYRTRRPVLGEGGVLPSNTWTLSSVSGAQRLILELCSQEFTIETGDVRDGDVLGALHFAGTGIRTVPEA